jgi:ferritin-like metal-binding protein YciE
MFYWERIKMKGLPQILLLMSWAVDVIESFRKNGETKPALISHYNFLFTSMEITIYLLLVTWGGFFK